MASVYQNSVSAYPVPTSDYKAHVNSMFKAAPTLYSNIPVAPPGIAYQTTLPGYQAQGQIQRSSTPIKHFAYPVSTTKIIDIIPTRKWLLETLKHFIFSNKGILIGDFSKYEIQKKDVIDKFYKRIDQLYPRDKYNITSQWLERAMANRDFLPEFASRLEEFPIIADLRIIINLANFTKLTRDMQETIEKHFNIQAEFNEVPEAGVRKVILCFRNHYIPDGQIAVFFVDHTLAATPLGISISPMDMKFQHDYLAYDGIVYSVMDTYNNYMEIDSEIRKGYSSSYLNTNVDSSMTLYEIINNIRNGIIIFMAYTDMETCAKVILDAKKHNYIEKKDKCMLVYDKFISPTVKLDFYIKVWNSEVKDCACAKCNVVIESGQSSAGMCMPSNCLSEIVCFTKCCRRAMHPSCMLELYLHEKSKQSTFRCKHCNVRRIDKYGRNTEILMSLLGLGI
jgi:hypothetical protein